MNDISRRHFIRTSLGVSAGALLLPAYVAAQQQSSTYQGGLLTGKPIPLPYKSIPGFLSEAQIAPHYTAHYGGALRGYLAADAKLQANIAQGKKIDLNAHGAMQRARTNKADSVILHELYFDGMTANTGKRGEEVHRAITRRFGSIEKWAADFQASAKAATGWAVLAYHPLNSKLYNVVSDKHSMGVLWMATPLLVIDVYEHAFYVDYKNNKTLYIEKFMEHINWDEINRRHSQIN